MGKRIMVDVLIGGSAVTGLIMLVQFARAPHGFMLALALINLATAAFMWAVVRPLLRGKLGTAKALAEGSLVVLLSSWSALFWIEFFSPMRQMSSLAGALTWSAAALACVADLVATRFRKPAAPEKTHA